MGTRYSSFLNFCLIGVKLDAMGFGMTLAKIWPPKKCVYWAKCICSKSKIRFNKKSKSIIWIKKEEKKKAKMILRFGQLMNWGFFVSILFVCLQGVFLFISNFQMCMWSIIWCLVVCPFFYFLFFNKKGNSPCRII